MNEDAGSSRRALLGAATTALAGGAAITLAGCGSARTGAQSVREAALPVRQTDIKLLGALLDLERQTVAAYTAAIPLLSRLQVRAAKQFLNEELEHTGELISLIKAADGKAPPNTAAYDLGQSGDAGTVLALLHRLERAQIVAYLDAIPRLSPASVRAAAATIMASDAQHIAILRSLQGLDPVPSAILTGQE